MLLAHLKAVPVVADRRRPMVRRVERAAPARAKAEDTERN